MATAAKQEKQQEPTQPPMMCAFDKDRVCDQTCTAFILLQNANGLQWGCKRMGGLQ